MKQQGVPTRWPRISVIVAGRDEADFIAECLKSLLALDYPEDSIEFLFVDDHSKDATLSIARSLAIEDSRLQVLSAPDEPVSMGSKKRALSHAIRHAAGEILLFTDADNRVSPGWAKAMVVEFDERTGAVLGAALPPVSSSLLRQLYRLERLFVMVTTASPVGWDYPASACGQNLALRKKVFYEIGGYARPEVPSGDDDLTVQAIAKAGHRVRFASSPESVVEDARLPNRAQHLNATRRHQSVVKFYPLRWRVLYLASFLSFGALLGLIAGLLYEGAALQPALIILAAVVFYYLFAAQLFARRLKIKLTIGSLLIAIVLLPFYLVMRPLAMLRRGYVWRGQTMNAAKLSS
jgi:cellulose synthase/poly-beta-1,6-N-acetylglucosamine synthase-like glycosyltransferase